MMHQLRHGPRCCCSWTSIVPMEAMECTTLKVLNLRDCEFVEDTPEEIVGCVCVVHAVHTLSLAYAALSIDAAC